MSRRFAPPPPECDTRDEQEAYWLAVEEARDAYLDGYVAEPEWLR